MKTLWPFAMCLLIGVSSTCWGAAFSEEGNHPLSPANYTAWPKLEEAVNDPSRISMMWCNGSEDLYYAGDTATLNRVVAKFSETEVDQLQVVLRPRQQLLRTKDGTPRAVDWSIHISGGLSKIDTSHVTKGSYSAGFPTLTIHVDEKTDLEEVQLPASVRVYQLEDLQEAYEDQFMLERGDVRAVSRARSQLQSLNGDQSRTGLSEEEYQAQIERIGAFVNALSKPQE